MAYNNKMIVALFSVLLLSSLMNISLGGEIVIYWGQYWDEGSLRETCDTNNYNITNLAFLNRFGSGSTPALSLAQCPGDCTWLSEEIKYCKSKGIKVLLSIGGAGTYNLSSPEDALNVAQYLWNNFLGGESASRPLGDAILDGIDFFIEAGTNHYYDVLVKALWVLGQGAEQKFYFAASPQCPYPDYYLQEAIETRLFDYVWVQFYRNPPCQYNDQDGAANLLNYWNNYWSHIPTSKLFLGLPASPEASAGGGYIEPENLITEVLPFIKTTPIYGGVMLWCKYYDSGYSTIIKPYVVGDDENNNNITTYFSSI